MFNRQWFLLILVPVLFSFQAGAATPGLNETLNRQVEARSLSRTPVTTFNGTVAHQVGLWFTVRADDSDDDGEGPVYYADLCGVNFRDGMTNVHNECDKNLLRASCCRIIQRHASLSVPSYVSDYSYHFLELQVVNSIAMAPVDDAPGNNNGACSAINAMLNVMDAKFPPDKNGHDVKGKLIRRFLTLPPQAQITALNAKEKRTLPALKTYIKELQISGNGLHLAVDLEDEWQPFIDKFYKEIAGYVRRRWPLTSTNARIRKKHDNKMAELAAGKRKFTNHKARLDERFSAAVNFILNYPEL
ncbi:hypothetical protein C8R43DRAFT_1241149 [Mycena crocata]|nr:hypothetical protein C8R43DRAFT_1241149 [Mycena crocata]